MIVTDPSNPPRAAMSIDVEDWFQVENLKSVIARDTWDERELRVVMGEWEKSRDFYASHPAEALAFTRVGQQPPLDQTRAPQIAAWMTVASLLLNLDEAMTME